MRKDALRVEAYGTVDEANAAIGVLRLHTGEDAVADAMLARIQNDLSISALIFVYPVKLGRGCASRIRNRHGWKRNWPR